MKTRTALAAAVVAALLAPGIGAAQDAPPDMAALEAARERGDFVTVREGLRQLVDTAPSPLARYRLALVLIEGRGGPRDPAGAIGQLDLAAAQSHFPSAVLLARLLLSGDAEGGRDPDRAAAVLRAPAEAGYADAQYYLGALQAVGDGVPRDAAAAADSFRAAAIQDHAEAQFALARAYHRGEGVGADPAEALRWLRAAATAGHGPAQLSLALTLDRQGAPAESLDWYRRAAEQESAFAQRVLGTRYLRGDDVTADADEGLRWLRRAADAGDAGAMSNIGWAHATGTGVPQDYAQARLWYGRAADASLGRAAVALGRLNAAGLGGPVDRPAAVALFRAALDTDAGGDAARALGGMVLDGALDGGLAETVAPQRAVPWVAALLETRGDAAEAWLRDRIDAGDAAAAEALGLWLFEQQRDGGMALLRDAARAGRVRAQTTLAETLATGAAGQPVDYVAAHAWFNIAASLGAADAVGRRDALTDLMTPEQVAAAQDRARDWFENDATAPLAEDR